MNSLPKRPPLLFIFLAVLTLRCFLAFISPPVAFPSAHQTFMTALGLGVVPSLAFIPLLWVSMQYYQKYMREVLVGCLTYVIAGRVLDVWYWENPFLYGFVSILVSLIIILGVYQWLVRKIKNKDKPEEPK